MAELFLDTSYAIAVSSPPDQYHERAVALAQQIEAQQLRFVTARAVVLEIGNALAKQRCRAAAVRLLEALERDPVLESRCRRSCVHGRCGCTGSGRTRSGD